MIMLFANSAAYFFTGHVNVSFRIVSSLAAPLFIFLVGANLAFSKNDSTKKFIHRGLYLFITASLIDVFAWKIYPFGTFDVLYLIAFGIIFCGLIRFGWITDLILGFGIVIISFFLKGIYRFEINETSIFEKVIINKELFTDFFFRAFVDGWFPVFPWMGYIFIGRAVMSRIESLRNIYVLILNFSAFVFCFWTLSVSTPNPVRANYIEIFYPITVFYVPISLTFVLLLIILLTKSKYINCLFSIEYSLMGQNSLFSYIIHCFIISLFAETFPYRGTNGFLLFCSLQLTSLYLILKILSKSRSLGITRKLPYSLIAILGLK